MSPLHYDVASWLSNSAHEKAWAGGWRTVVRTGSSGFINGGGGSVQKGPSLLPSVAVCVALGALNSALRVSI